MKYIYKWIGTLIAFILICISFEHVKGNNWLLLCGYIIGILHAAWLSAVDEAFDNED